MMDAKKTARIAGVMIWALFTAGIAQAEKPPVDVQVVVGDDEEEDFFDDDDEQEKEKKPDQADENDSSSVKVEKKGDGGNVNTNVINVVVGGQQQEAKAQAQATEKEVEIENLEQDMSDARARIEEKKNETPAPKPEEKAPAVHHDGSHHWWKSWSKAPGVREGDVLFSILGGKSGGGGFAGGALEFMLDDKIGLRGRGLLSMMHDHDRGEDGFGLGFSEDGRWAGLTSGSFLNADRGAVHMVEAVMSYHFAPKKRFDPYVTLGVAHFGYFVDRNGSDDPDIGGAVYARGGVGFNWFWRSLFIGAELGWYPGELLRYTAESVPHSSESRRGDHDRRVVVVEDVRDRWDAKRVNFAGHVGLRF